MKTRAENEKVITFTPRVKLACRILTLLYKTNKLTLNEISRQIQVDDLGLLSVIDSLEVKGFIEHSGNTRVGEEAVFSIHPGGNCIVGLDLGGTKLYGAACDLTGSIHAEQQVKIEGKTGDACLEVIIELIEHLSDAAARENLKVAGIGVDVPGRVHLETGVVVRAPAVGMVDYPLKERLVARFGYPTFIDNDLKQAAIGEAWFGAGKNYRHVVLLSIGTGIAAGMLVDGFPLRGAHERLGELGWMAPGPDFLGRKYTGFGALETEASGPGIIARARRILSGSNDEQRLEELTGEAVFAAARNGEKWAEQTVNETIGYLAVLVANIMAFYDPDIIILSGGVARSGEQLIPPILKLVDGAVLTPPVIVPSTLGYRAGALGAVINLIQNCPEFLG